MDNTAQIYKDFLNDPNNCPLPDFSYAGYQYGNEEPTQPRKITNVADHGILSGTGEDLREKVQKLINQIGQSGGGTIYFPSGEYKFLTQTPFKPLEINYSNVHLRGSGTSTVFRQCHDLTQTKLPPWLSPALIRTGMKLQGTEKFWGVPFLKKKTVFGQTGALQFQQDGKVYEAPLITQITKDAFKGDRTLSVASTEGINTSDIILLSMRNTEDSGKLLHELIAPIENLPESFVSAISAGPLKAASYQWLVEVDSINENSITLKQPLRRDIQQDYQPEIYSAPMLRNISIENIAFTSDWAGPYGHHGLPDSTIPEAAEMDAGWNAIGFTRVAHGWIRNVTIEHSTVPIQLLDCRNITVKDVTITDPRKIGGHYALKCYSHACDNLFENIQVTAYRTHGTGVEGNCYGNVFRNITFENEGNQVTEFDSHGFCDTPFSPPACNLFENIKGQSFITGGGAGVNLPHTSHYNTFWNYECHELKENNELFWSYQAKNAGLSSSQMFPKTILVGMNSIDKSIHINGSNKNIQNKWLYTEFLNDNKVEPQSLYQAQLELRK